MRVFFFLTILLDSNRSFWIFLQMVHTHTAFCLRCCRLHSHKQTFSKRILTVCFVYLHERMQGKCIKTYFLSNRRAVSHSAKGQLSTKNKRTSAKSPAVWKRDPRVVTHLCSEFDVAYFLPTRHNGVTVPHCRRLLRLLACSFCSTIPQREERLLIV